MSGKIRNPPNFTFHKDFPAALFFMMEREQLSKPFIFHSINYNRLSQPKSIIKEPSRLLHRNERMIKNI